VDQHRDGDEDLGLHVDEQPMRRRRLAREVHRMDQARRAVRTEHLGEAAAPVQRLRRGNRAPLAVARAQQRLVADSTPVREAVHRLEGAAQTQRAQAELPVAGAVLAQRCVQPLEGRAGERSRIRGVHGFNARRCGRTGMSASRAGCSRVPSCD
jgi:hypothetical protein